MSRRIHRRRNEQIQKDFLCNEGCGKAYGSFAALFTHIHKKHPEAQPPQMRSQTRQLTGRVGRPVEVTAPLLEIIDCKICNASPCVCPEDFDSIDFLIQVMADDRFIRMTNAIGSLALDAFTFVRNTEDQYNFKHVRDIQILLQTINHQVEQNGLKIKNNNKLNTFLSVCSRYWAPENMEALYQSIIIMGVFEEWNECERYYRANQQRFACVNNLLGERSNQFKQLFDIVKSIE